MITGIGCDIVKIERIAGLISGYGDKFLKRIFTEKEIELSKFIKNPDKSVNYYAKRFAAKEAISKALGIGIGEKLSFLDIEITNDENGKPLCNISLDDFKSISIMLSLADETEYAIAYCLAIKE